MKYIEEIKRKRIVILIEIFVGILRAKYVLLNSYILKNPKGLYEVKMQKLDNLVDKLNIYTTNIFESKETKYISLIDKMEALNPIKTLKRGYSITKVDNKVADFKKIKKDMIITTEFSEGEVISKVMEVKNGN